MMAANSLNFAFHCEQLAEWLAQYYLDRRLREPVSETMDVSVYKEQSPNYWLPTPGQIRLLRPTTVSLPDVERPVYVLLMPAESTDAIRLIPFSRYAIPATPQEWRTGFSQQPLRVLCLWNQRVCGRARLPANWLVRSITPKQQSEVARELQMSHGLDTYALRRFGPPLLHPFDPRHVYLQEERMLLNDLYGASSEKPKTIIEYPVFRADSERLLAAESPLAYGAEEPEEASETD